jgi:hypothetical protein
MARRTIRARRASPYLLYLVIAFSLLTVAAAVGWGWMYSLKNQAEQTAFGRARIEAPGANIQDLMSQVAQGKVEKDSLYEEKAGDLYDMVLAQKEWADRYIFDAKQLAQRLTGDDFATQQGQQLRQSVADTLKAAATLLEDAGKNLQKSYQVGPEGATGEVKMTSAQASIRALMQRIDALVIQVKQDSAGAADLQTKIKGLQDELAAAKAEQARQVAQLQANLDDEKKRLTKARDDAVAQSNQFKEELARATDQFLVRLRQAGAEKDKLQRDMSVLQNNLKDVTTEVAKFRKVPTEQTVNGHIISVGSLGGVAYGDLGKKDGVLLGMPFAIFSVSEIGKTEPKPKAHCRIVKIMNDSSEMRVFQSTPDNPIVVGDVLYNPVYDRQRRLHFVLVGKMDINSDGVDETEQLKALIQEFGGRMDGSLTIQADYLVVGAEPAVPAPPAAGASPMERQTYEDARRRFIEFNEARAKAENFSIPILNLNRFLGLLGLAGQG